VLLFGNPVPTFPEAFKPVHPDALVVHMLTTHPTAVLAIIQCIIDSLVKHPLTNEAYLANLANSALPNSAALLRPLMVR